MAEGSASVRALRAFSVARARDGDVTDVHARELATALRLTRFRGEMADDVFAQLVKEVVRVLYPVLGELPVRRGFDFPPLKVAPAI